MLKRMLLLVALAASAAQLRADKSLYWKSVDVQANLDRDGRLHVVERQAIVFNGDWNGGYRRFNTRLGQDLDFESISRVDAGGAETPLVKGNLDNVDHWDWVDGQLRWRSRRPSDPEFDNTQITYVLRYTLSNILVARDGGWALDHNFIFPDREDRIEHFSLDLSFDPAWRVSGENPLHLERDSLMPGDNLVVTVPLQFTGTGAPAAVPHLLPFAVRAGLALVLGIAFLFLFFQFDSREKSLGRYEPLVPVSQIDRAWLEKNLLSMKPEVAGAAWDATTSAPEVGAVLARLVSEGKLESRVEKGGFLSRDVLHLKMLVDRGSFSGYEASLVNSLFVDGDETDTDKIRKHYSSSGFDPVSKIRDALTRDAARVGAVGSSAPPVRWKPSLLLLLVAIATLVFGATRGSLNTLVVAVAGGVTIALFFVSIITAAFYKNLVTGFGRAAFFTLVPMLAASVGAIVSMFRLPVGIVAAAGLVLFNLALWMLVFNTAKSKDGAERIAARKRLAAARAYFEQELRSEHPRLEDSWYPYLIAFGLGANVDKWFRSFGGRSMSHSGFGTSGSNYSSSSSTSPTAASGWTGGGGSFGGAGASGAWAAAAAGIASGVSAPSSSSSGGGGGGSSGGGGGGGW